MGIEKNTRLKTLIFSLGITQREFCEQTGLKFSSVSQYANGDRSLTERAIFMITTKFPNVNSEYLRTGKGEMFIDSQVAEGLPKDADPPDAEEVGLRRQVESIRAELARMTEDLGRERSEKRDLLEIIKKLTDKYG